MGCRLAGANMLRSKKIGRFLDIGIDKLSTISFRLSGLALLLIITFYVLEVVLRYLFNSPTSFTIDFTQWLLAAMVMLALPEVTRTNGHIVISFFLEKMSKATRQKLERSLKIVGCFLCLTAAWICLGESIRQYGTDIQTEWINPIPKWWISIFLPYGFGLSGLQFLKMGIKS
jgi:C4-dicarboxylate transporter DctQ subunit